MAHDAKVLVLLVEDEPLVRRIACENLEDIGFRVLEAGSAAEALKLMISHGDVGVLFTDVTMPGQLDGLSLAELVHTRWPEVKLVVTSALTPDRRVPDEGTFLRKPYTMNEMARAIAAARSGS